MAQANGGARASALADLDRTMLRLRRLMTRMPTTSLPIRGMNRSVDLAKVIACEAVGELSSDGPATVKDVAAVLALDPSTASRLLAEAEAEGLLTRTPHPEDRRRVVLSLTATGEQAIAGAAQARVGLLAYLVESFTDDDVLTLAGLMERLADQVDTRMPAWPGPTST